MRVEALIKYLRDTNHLVGALFLLLAIASVTVSPPTWAGHALEKYDYGVKALIKLKSVGSGSNGSYSSSSVRIYLLLPSLRSVTVTQTTHTTIDAEGQTSEQAPVLDVIESQGPEYDGLLYLLFPITGLVLLVKPSAKRAKWTA